MNAFPLQPVPLSITKGEGESGVTETSPPQHMMMLFISTAAEGDQKAPKAQRGKRQYIRENVGFVGLY